MLEVKSVLFDLDGTLTDPYDGITSSVKYALGQMGFQTPDAHTLGDFIGPPLTHSFMRYCGMTADEASRALALYRKYYDKHGMFALRVYDGVMDMLETLKAAGKKLYIATSKPERNAVMIADRFGFSRCLDGVAGASDDLSRIEKADVINYAVQRFGIEKESAVMVGDRKYDVDGAAKCGIPCIGVTYGYGKTDEFARAAHIASTPEETARIILNS